ncbi:SMI1/KNR4 family protein [Streptomyces sp. NPDC058308]|uniref:SMI1/KNR4 family protein n=1 Tax=Streptomyces sp. NPDC058308 TaxID=3346440 RepID=UPI0036F01B90
MLTELKRLTSLLPPPGEPTNVSWAGTEESWGSRFPADYVAFMDLYGPGAIEDCLVVLGPEVQNDEPGDGMSSESRTARVTWDREPKRLFTPSAAPRLVAWGVTDSADVLCWDAASGAPEEWPVVVWNNDDGRWTRFECGMVQFLGDLIEGLAEPCPPGAESLSGAQIARFLAKAEEDRLWAQGIDPWEE